LGREATGRVAIQHINRCLGDRVQAIMLGGQRIIICTTKTQHRIRGTYKPLRTHCSLGGTLMAPKWVAWLLGASEMLW
jgi:hypothetical protein